MQRSLKMARLLEEERLAALAAYDVLDTPPEAAFDDLTKLAAQVCEVPIALVSLVDRERQWFKSCVGLEARETPRAVAFCAHAIDREGPFIVPDTHEDARFAENPLVTGPPRIRYYAGFPLIDEDGAALGTLCVIDVRPRALGDLQMTTLRVLAKQVVAQLHLRRTTASLRRELARQAEATRVREQAQAEDLARANSLRRQIELAHRRASFLAEAGKLLSESLDTDRTLEAVARLSVPTVADLCTIMVCEEDGSLRRVAEAGLDAARETEMRVLREGAISRDAPLAMKQAMAEQRALLFDDYRAWLLGRLPADHPYVAVVERLGARSSICAPMLVGGRVLGVLNVATQRRSGRTFDTNDLVTISELAQRAAVALQNARLFAEAQMERARAEHASRTKDEFLAAVSHDLRTPLNAILGWTHMLRTRPEDAKLASRALEVIDRSARAQSRLIEDLLDVSQIAAGQLHVQSDPVDLVAIVEIALDALRPTAEERNVRLEASLAPDAKHGIGDFDRLQQVVWNLVSNAIKFSKKGGLVEVRLAREDGCAKLTVRDDGRGIEPELLPHVFERFRQDDRGVGRRLGGLGLGLAIAKHIVETVGGTIRAHSTGVGEGATFTVVLPLAASVPESRPPLTAATAGNMDDSALRGTRVLVVDDEAQTRALLTEFLGAHGMTVSTAESAEEGFAAFQRERPDVLVSDVIMPGASGYDLVRRVRDLSPQDGGRTPALALTASIAAADRKRAVAAGFDFYVPKPIEPAELLTVLTALRAREA